SGKEREFSEQKVNKNPPKIVNRWIVDYYFSVAVEFFKNHQYADFCGVRTILDNVLERPTESVDDMLLKLRVLQFLSRINEGDKLSELFVFITLIE
uniref:Telomere repeat-binding factor dimerisation domain-containing protein n=1 Tax=Cyprinodon variegatus TaxID=28743 RepID=A0A3Q2CW40_CYPVA